MTILIGKIKKYKSTPPKWCKKTDEATGFSECTVNRVMLEKRMLNGSSFTSPNKWCKESREHVDVKGHIKEHNKKFTLSAVKDLTYEGFWR